MSKQRRTLQAIATALSLALPGAALAQTSAPGWGEPVPAPAEESYDTITKRYGIQIVAVDATAWAVAIASEQGAVLLGGYLLGGPMVHIANGNTKTAFGSLAMRAGFPLVGGLIGSAAAAADCEDSEEMFCGLGHIAAGMLLGMVTASVIDAAVLAKKTTRERREPSAFRYGSLAANPDLRVTKNGSVTLGFTGRF